MATPSQLGIEPGRTKRCGACQDCCSPFPVWCDSWGPIPPAMLEERERRRAGYERARTLTERGNFQEVEARALALLKELWGEEKWMAWLMAEADEASPADPVDGPPEAGDPLNIVVSAGHIPISKQLFDDTVGVRRTLHDCLPRMMTTAEQICFHTPPTPFGGGRWRCLKCGKSYRAVYKRPRREPEHYCYECGHVTPKGPKQPKRWMWEEVPPAKKGA